jgi:hypothetical protein
MKTCPCCGTSFELRHPNQIYCRPECQVRAQKKRSKKKEREKVKARNLEARLANPKRCSTCGCQFIPLSNSSKYCGDGCRPWLKPPKPKKEKALRLTERWRPCLQCGQEFFSRRPIQICSDECRRQRGKEYQLKKCYGITVDRLEQMLELQQGRCLICKAKKKLVVDHCHNHGHVRGLLCSNCNSGLGYFADSIENFENAILYLHERGCEEGAPVDNERPRGPSQGEIR